MIRDILEKIIFKNKNFNDKKVLVVYLKEHENLANELKEKYPSEDYYLINEVNFETQIKTLLDIDASFSRFLTYLNLIIIFKFLIHQELKIISQVFIF